MIGLLWEIQVGRPAEDPGVVVMSSLLSFLKPALPNISTYSYDVVERCAVQVLLQSQDYVDGRTVPI